jgi:hypothetical protein
VITSAFAVSAKRIAALWLSASCSPLRFLIQGRALSSSIHAYGSFAQRRTRACLENADMVHGPRNSPYDHNSVRSLKAAE